ncbi:MAG: sulfatase [Planctomycetaceae bacterium]|nr:sulfatase [Planctomycetaceae bacterium]
MVPSTPTRRDLLKQLSCGFGYAALAGMATEAAAADSSRGNPLSPRPAHFAPRARRVIFLCMRGGPSHVDTFDHKPQLAVDDGKPAPGKKGRKLMQSPWKFSQHGKSGQWISELFPQVARHADDLCILNGMHADVPSHPECFVQLHTGSFQFVRPSMGAWVLYGLGTENANLPGFITLNPPSRVGGAQNYGSSFLPAFYQGTRIGQLGQSLKDATVGNLKNPRLGTDLQRRQVDFVQSLNRGLLERRQSDEQLEGVIESYELAFRMQSELPRVLDFSGETKPTLDAYGVDGKPTDVFARQCILARRLAEAGVRFIELSHANWDQHGGLRNKLTANCTAVDQPIAALLADLKQRDMLKDTLVVWGGEFGRTPHVKKPDGRDHNSSGFSFWMAGGGVKAGLTHGTTDPHGIESVSGKVHFHDLHATMLHLLGLDHKRLTYRYAGRDFRLTDVHGNVVKEILA